MTLLYPNVVAPQGINQGRGYNIPYIVYRFGIKNIGQVVAEDCRGYLLKDGNPERVSWNFPANRSSVAIQPSGREELELFAAISTDTDYFNNYNQTTFDENGIRTLYDQLRLPQLLAPTERGFESPMSHNRIISPGHYELKVTSVTDNTTPLLVPIDIG